MSVRSGMAFVLAVLLAGAACDRGTAAAPPAGPDPRIEKAIALAEAIPLPALAEVRRGCPACHSVKDPATGKYSLPFEAHERVAARGRMHPDLAPDNTSLLPTENVNVKTCLLCHAPAKGARAGRGIGAPLALRDIVHPAHMNSQGFKLRNGGNCFTCHNVSGDGVYQLLTEKVTVNEKGVPDPEMMPIPGAVDPKRP